MKPTARRLRLSALLLVTAVAISLVGPLRADAATWKTPTGLYVTAATTSTLHLDWQPVPNASGYRVKIASSSAMTDARNMSVRYSSAMVRGLTPNTRYWFRVAVAANHGTGRTLSGYTPAPYPSGRTSGPAAAPPPLNGSYDLNVASYNISVIMGDSSTVHEAWAARRTKVAQELLGQLPADQTSPAPDVLAVQEADTSRKFADGVTTQYTDLVKALNTYATGTDHYSAISGTAAATHLIYNDHTLTLLQGAPLKWDAQESKVDGARYMFWGKFRVKSTGDQFFFSSSHLETASETVRRAQWQQLVDDVPTMAGGLPIILGGDFNSPRHATNPTAGVMLPKMYAAGIGDTLGQNSSAMVHVSSSRAKQVLRGNIFSLNKWNRSMNHYANPDYVGQSIDYLFASNNLAVKRWQMVVDDAKDFSLDGTIPSDHNLIKATITLP